MTKIFEQDFSDGTSIWCHIQNENYVLGIFGRGQSLAIYKQLKTQKDIQDYIQENGLCPNDFCQGGYIDEGFGEKRTCPYCNDLV